jgi:hypothetical protein
MEKIGRERRSESVWREIVARQRASGLTVQSFCEREGIKLASLYGWRAIASALSRTQVSEFPRIGQTAVTAKCPEMQQCA